MKKTSISIFLIVLLVFGFAGCKKDDTATVEVTAADVWNAVLSAFPEDFFPVLMELDASTLDKFYGISSEDTADFVGHIPLMNVSASEVLIIKPSSGGEDKVLAGIEQRRAALEERWSEYLPEQYALVQDHRLVQNEGWILFAISEDADKIVEIFTEQTSPQQ